MDYVTPQIRRRPCGADRHLRHDGGARRDPRRGPRAEHHLRRAATSIAKLVPGGRSHMTLDEALKLSPRAARDVRERRAGAKAHRHGARPRGHAAPRLDARRGRRHHRAPGRTITSRWRRTTTAIVTQYTMTTLEELGLLKMDFLGLRNLTVLEDAVRDWHADAARTFDWRRRPGERSRRPSPCSPRARRRACSSWNRPA